jgi:hypothetical protein
LMPARLKAKIKSAQDARLVPQSKESKEAYIEIADEFLREL